MYWPLGPASPRCDGCSDEPGVLLQFHVLQQRVWGGHRGDPRRLDRRQDEQGLDPQLRLGGDGGGFEDGKAVLSGVGSTAASAISFHCQERELSWEHFGCMYVPSIGLQNVFRPDRFVFSVAVSGHVARRALYTPILSGNCSHVSACNAYRGMHDGESVDSYVGRLAQELEDEFQRIGPGKVCAFVAEPVVGVVSSLPELISPSVCTASDVCPQALGCVPAVPGYFPAMKAVCDRHGALLILDEVMSGMGRVGSLHAWEQEGVVPDLQTIAKGLGGGYAPIGGLLVGSKVVDVLNRGTGAFMHGQTYQGHALACAAAVEVQRIIKEENLLKNVQVMGALLEKSLKARLSPHVHVGDIRGKGLFMGVSLSYTSHYSMLKPFRLSL